MGRARRWIAALAGAACAAGVAPAAATADAKVVFDPRDADRVDAVRASHRHHPSRPAILVHTVRLVTPAAGARQLVRIVIDVWLPDGDRDPDRAVHVEPNADGSFRVYVTDEAGGVRGHARASMPRPGTVRLAFSTRLLRPRLGWYRWRLSVISTCAPDSGVVCAPAVDRAPNARRVVHDLRP